MWQITAGRHRHREVLTYQATLLTTVQVQDIQEVHHTHLRAHLTAKGIRQDTKEVHQSTKEAVRQATREAVRQAMAAAVHPDIAEEALRPEADSAEEAQEGKTKDNWQ